MNTNQQDVSFTSKVDAIRVMVGDQWLLLPMAAVAEVVRSITVVNRENDSESLHGWLQWRNTEIPLIAFEMLMGGKKARHRGVVNALVINTLGQLPGCNFYALLIDDLPQPARINDPSGISKSATPIITNYQLMTVVHEQLESIIPDLQSLEEIVLSGL